MLLSTQWRSASDSVAPSGRRERPGAGSLGGAPEVAPAEPPRAVEVGRSRIGSRELRQNAARIAASPERAKRFDPRRHAPLGEAAAREPALVFAQRLQRLCAGAVVQLALGAREEAHLLGERVGDGASAGVGPRSAGSALG